MLDILAAASGANASPSWAGWLPIVGMILIFWFLIIRPQMRQAKQHREKVAALKRGDEVVTAGGLVGKIAKVDEHYVEIDLAKGVRVRAVRSTIGDVIKPGTAPAAND
ncbi:MAG: preprotein translocase subunit YajC [Qipengyuania sp.]